MNKKKKSLNNQKVISVKEFWEQYFTNKKTFDSKNPVFVSFNADFNMGERAVAQQEGLIPITARAYHDQTNLNGSTITTDIFQEKTDSIVFRPILANIVENDEGVKDFGAHDFTFVEDGEGNISLDYQEKPIGVITQYSFEFDEENQVNRAVTQGYLYEEYCGDALKILERRGAVDCSVELMVKNCHFDEESLTLCLDDYYVSGLTLLGAEHDPGMAGSNASLVTETEIEVSADDIMIDNALPEEIGPTNPTLVTKDDEVEEELAIERAKDKEPEPVAELSVEPVEELEESEPEPEQHEYDDAVREEEDSSDDDEKQLDEFAELKAEIERLQKELSEYKTKEDNALKEEVLNDPLYAPYLESEAFTAVISRKDEMDVKDLKNELAVAFTQVKRSESEEKPNPVVQKVFYGKTANLLRDEEDDRYGPIFDKIKDKRRK